MHTYFSTLFQQRSRLSLSCAVIIIYISGVYYITTKSGVSNELSEHHIHTYIAK